MLVERLRAKIHIMRVTESNKDYDGSLTIPKSIIDAAGMNEYDRIRANNVETGKSWITYLIPGKEGEVCANGAAANHFNPGDRIHILQYALYDNDYNRPIIVYCDKDNRLL
jgi:aspartate 1-decarboxylase